MGFGANFEIEEEVRQNLSAWLPYLLGAMSIDRDEYKYATQRRRDLLLYCAAQSIKAKNGEGLDVLA